MMRVLHCASVSWFNPRFPPLGTNYPTVSLHQSWSLYGSTGISTSYPSTMPFGLILGPDLPWEDEPSPGILGHSTVKFLTLLSLLMPAFSLVCSPPLLSIWLQPNIHCSSTNLHYCKFPSFGSKFEPRYIVGASSLDQWAITHSLNEWLLLSQHPGCLSDNTSFYT